MAVADARKQLSYADLRQRVATVRAQLTAAGVVKGTIVGVATERSAELVPTLLAVWSLNAIYVPLDPEYPRDRLQLFVEDSGATHVLTERALVSRLDLGARPVLLDEPFPAADLDLERFELPRGEDLAYLIHTSGSTGRPKAVAVSHHSVANTLEFFARHPGLSTGDVMLAIAPTSFDISFMELLLPVTTGASVYIATRDQARSGALLARALRESRATVLQATPTTFRLLLDSGWEGNPALRLWSGGEPLDVDLAQALLSRSRKLYNVYGPTEATIWMTVHEVTPPLAFKGFVPVGLPIDNTSVVIAGDDGRPVPRGEQGEVYLGGINLAVGYWQNEHLTRERFVENHALPGERLYRTGDLGSISQDGILSVIGRSDDQVKVGGRRLELGEVEACLRQHPSVRSAVVVLRTHAGGDEYLAAYVTPSHPSPSAHELRRFVAKWLPDYMVPRAVVAVDALPLLSNGKLDRKALPDPDEMVQVVREGELDEHECRILEAVRHSLHAPDLEVDDDFTSVGAFSLALARLRARLGVASSELTMVDLYRHSSARRLARRLEELGGRNASPVRAPAHVISDWTHRLLMQRLCMPGAATWNELVAFELAVDAALLRRAWEIVAQRHVALRSRFDGLDREKPVRAADDSMTFPVEEAVATELKQLKDLELRAFFRDFDLTTGPLSRVLVVRGPGDRTEMIWVFHHSILDGPSAARVIEDLLATCDALLACDDLPAHAPTEEVLAVMSQERALAFWHDVLRDAPRVEAYHEFVGLGAKDMVPMTERLKTDLRKATAERIRGALERTPTLRRGLEALGADPARWGSGVMNLHTQAISTVSLKELERFAKTHRVTLSGVLVAAWSLHLMATSGARDLVFGVIARPDGAGTVGNVATTLPLRVKLEGDEEVGAWLVALQERLLTMIENGQVSLPALVRAGAVNDDFMDVVYVDWSYWHWANLSARFPRLRLGAARALSVPVAKVILGATREELTLSTDYTLFDAQRVARWLVDYVATLDRLSSSLAKTRVESLIVPYTAGFGMRIG
jgi:amino acid adenylation domain-containing protein